VEGGEVVHEPEVDVERERVVALGDQRVGQVAEEDRSTVAVVGRADVGVVDAVGGEVEEAGPPHEQRAVGQITGRPHDPVVVAREVLHDVPRPVDGDAFEAGTRLGICRVHRLTVGRTGEELVDGGGHRTGCEHCVYDRDRSVRRWIRPSQTISPSPRNWPTRPT